MSRLVVVTATTNLERARPCIESWGDVEKVVVPNGGSSAYLGTVPAFRLGVDAALQQYPDAEVIACLHDDLELQDPQWVQKVLDRFDRQPAIGLLGFGGAIGLGADEIYKTAYQPVQLARKGFRSNLVDAEVHGLRSLLPERVACLDGFSQIGRRAFWEGWGFQRHRPDGIATVDYRPWHVLQDLGLIHHIYDSALGLLAARYGWETWYLPIRCKHWGGQTAVGDAGYQAWAKQQVEGGDHGFWEQGHRAVYDAFVDTLPLRV